MNDSLNVQLCEEITAAWMLWKPIRYDHNFSSCSSSAKESWFQRLEKENEEGIWIINEVFIDDY